MEPVWQKTSNVALKSHALETVHSNAGIRLANKTSEIVHLSLSALILSVPYSVPMASAFLQENYVSKSLTSNASPLPLLNVLISHV